MVNKELRQQEADLEKQLEQQLGVFKKESDTWVKIGGAALAGGLLSYGIARVARGKKDKKLKKAIRELEQEGKIDQSLYKKNTKKHKSSLMGSFGKRLLMVLFSLGQAKLIDELQKRALHVNKR
ncbi:hypothetical protein GCM10028791_23700 [Echinicola sediminis]